MGDLTTLLERVEKASAGDNQLSVEVCAALVGDDYYSDVSTSIDAAIALVEKTLPDYWIESLGEKRTPIRFVNDVHEPTGKWFARLQHWEGGKLKEAEAATLPLAILGARLRALIAKDTETK